MFSAIKLSKGIPPQYNLVNSANDFCSLYQHKTKANKFIGSVIVPVLFDDKPFYFLMENITQDYVNELLYTKKGLSLEEFDDFFSICYKKSMEIIDEYGKNPLLSKLKKSVLLLPIWSCAFLIAMKQNKDIQPVIYAICQLAYTAFSVSLSELKEKAVIQERDEYIQRNAHTATMFLNSSLR